MTSDEQVPSPDGPSKTPPPAAVTNPPAGIPSAAVSSNTTEGQQSPQPAPPTFAAPGAGTPVHPTPQAAYPQTASYPQPVPQPPQGSYPPPTYTGTFPNSSPSPAPQTSALRPSGSAWGNGPIPPGSAPAAPAGYGAPSEPRPAVRRKGLGLTALIAAGTALVTAVATALTVVVLTDGRGTRTTSIAQIGQSTTTGVPVTESSVDSPNWQAVAAAVKPSVVAIAVTTDEGDGEGSGFILTADGDVLTNDHVVDGAKSDRVLVTLSDGRIFEAKIVGTDPTTDLAVVRIVDAPNDLTPAALGSSESVAVGQEVMAVGNPLGLQNTVTTGIVSAVNRPVTTAMGSDADTVVTNAIQVDAAINPGNSGGPLFDGEGRVIGITSSIASLSAYESGSIGLGFAIPVDLAKNIASQLVEDGAAEHAFLGLRLADGSATADGVTRRGAKVVSVTAGSPASIADVLVGDVVVAVNDEPTPGAESLTAYVRTMTAGDKATLTLVRDGKALEIEVTVAVRSEDGIVTATPTPSPSKS